MQGDGDASHAAMFHIAHAINGEVTDIWMVPFVDIHDTQILRHII